MLLSTAKQQRLNKVCAASIEFLFQFFFVFHRKMHCIHFQLKEDLIELDNIMKHLKRPSNSEYVYTRVKQIRKEIGFLYGRIQIFYRNWTAKTTVMQIDPNASIRNLKSKICEKEKVPEEIFYIVYEGRILKEENTLADHNITDLSTLHLNLRLRSDVHIDLCK